MTVVIVQCRLSSVRLANKAMMMLDVTDADGAKPWRQEPLVWWTLRAMKCVAADKYVLATDEASIETLRPVALKSGYEIMAGPLEDVLERFSIVIRAAKADTVVRATADNPFLFYEAASSLLDEYNKRGDADYITYRGLPHGSGVEVMNAQSLLRAGETRDVFEREHVGPALYNHKYKFKCMVLDAPSRFYHPELRTTVDTATDLRRARLIAHTVALSRTNYYGAFTTEEILRALDEPCVKNPVLFVPSLQSGRGTGHLRRCTEAASKINGFVLVEEKSGNLSRDITDGITQCLEPWQIVHEMPQRDEGLPPYALIVADRFALTEEEARNLSDCAPLLSIDDGGKYTDFCDCLVDIIPSALDRKANITAPSLMEMPRHVKNNGSGGTNEHTFHKVLVSFGGEDPSHLTFTAAKAVFEALKRAGDTSPVVVAVTTQPPSDDLAGIKVTPPVPLLKETLFDYDLVITHYGLTAYEARAAGCAVLLFATTPLHGRLAKKYGFVCLKSPYTASKIDRVLKNLRSVAGDVCGFACSTSPLPASPVPLPPLSSSTDETLPHFIQRAVQGRRLPCPVCGAASSKDRGSVVARATSRTYRRCPECGMIYMSWTMAAPSDYSEDYFVGQYKKQYGKTYLEDFEAIKAQGARRIGVIDTLFQKSSSPRTVLDIGCAYGPFLQAAKDDGWMVFGTDVSEEAVSYVHSHLLFPASAARFPDFDAAKEFGLSQFDAITMWFVIEHFQDLSLVLRAVSKLLKTGGVFAFSTPSGEGVSALLNKDSFFERSPCDHYTIWEPSRARSVLKKYSLKVERIISTGHHANRFPSPVQQLGENTVTAASRFLKLGDTCEIYARKQ